MLGIGNGGGWNNIAENRNADKGQPNRSMRFGKGSGCLGLDDRVQRGVGDKNRSTKARIVKKEEITSNTSIGTGQSRENLGEVPKKTERGRGILGGKQVYP